MALGPQAPPRAWMAVASGDSGANIRNHIGGTPHNGLVRTP